MTHELFIDESPMYPIRDCKDQHSGRVIPLTKVKTYINIREETTLCFTQNGIKDRQS